MRFRFYDFQRIVFTFFSKFFVEIAKYTHFQWTIPVTDFFLKKRGEALAKEAKESMYQVKIWQKKAEKCIAAYHEFEIYLKAK